MRFWAKDFRKMVSGFVGLIFGLSGWRNGSIEVLGKVSCKSISAEDADQNALIDLLGFEAPGASRTTELGFRV